MADNVRVKVLDIDASQSTQSIAGLKKEIRDLKDRLASLNEGTEEYNQTLSECAEKTHQLREIQEQVSKTSQDFGDRMSNVRGIIGGMSGAIGAITGALSLMGVEADKDSKLLKVMVSAMSITSGVQAIDAGVKSFKALTISINAASAASKKLYASLGIIGIILGVVAAAIYSVKQAEEEAEEAAIEAQKGRIQRLEEFQEKLSKFEHDYEADAEKMLQGIGAEDFGRVMEAQFDQWAIAVQYGYTELAEAGKNGVKAYGGTLIKAMEDLSKSLEEQWKSISDNMRNDAEWENSEEGIEALRVYYEGRIQYMQMAYAKELQLFQMHKDNMSIEEQTAHYEALAQLKKNLAELLKEQQAYFDKASKARTTNTTKEKTEADKAYAELLKKLKDRYNLEVAEIKLAHAKGEIDNIQYHQRLYDALVAHNKRMLRQAKQSAAEIKQAELAEAEAAAATQKAILERYEKDVRFTIDREYEGYDDAIKKMRKQVEQRMALERELTDVIYGEFEERQAAINNIKEMLSSVEDGWDESPYWEGMQAKITMAFQSIVGGSEVALPWLERIEDYFSDAASSKAADKWANSIVTSTKWMNDMFSGESDRITKGLNKLDNLIKKIGDSEMSTKFRESFLENAQWIENLLSGEEDKVYLSVKQINRYFESLGEVDVSDEWIVNLMKDEKFLTDMFSETAGKRERALRTYKKQVEALMKAPMLEEWNKSIMKSEEWMTKFVSNSALDRKEAVEELNEWLKNEGAGTEAAKKWADNMDWMAKITTQDFTYVYEAYSEFFNWLGGDALNTIETELTEFQVIQAQMLSDSVEERLKAADQMHALLVEKEREYGAIYVEQIADETDNMFLYNRVAMKRNMDDVAEMDEFYNRMVNGSFSDRQRAFDEYAVWEEKRNEKRTLDELEDEQSLLEARFDILERNKQAALSNLETQYGQERAIIMNELEQETLDIDRRAELQQNLITLENETAQARFDIELQYASDKQQLELDITANEREQSMQRIAMAKSEKERKQQLLQQYSSAATSIMSYTSQLISALQANLDTSTKEGFEKNKNYERANATISFLQGLVSAWASAMQLTYPANVIVGAANSALLTGIYAANLAQINSTTLSGSGGGATPTNAVTVQSIEHSPTNVRQTTTSSDYEEIGEREGDRRVYVLASDIEEVTGGRRTQVSNATY